MKIIYKNVLIRDNVIWFLAIQDLTYHILYSNKWCLQINSGVSCVRNSKGRKTSVINGQVR